jgi:glycosyltransferase involved in cell wall biosynthesis
VEHEQSGLAVPHTASAFAGALARLCTEKSYAAQLGGALKAHVVKSFSIPTMVAQTVAIYELP